MLLAPRAVPWGTDEAWGTGEAVGGRAGAGRGGRRWAGAWGAVGGGSRVKPSPDFHPAAAQAGGCLEHPGSPGLCRPHGHHQLPPRRGPSTQVQPIPVPSTQSPPAPAHPSPGCFLGAPLPAARCPSHRTARRLYTRRLPTRLHRTHDNPTVTNHKDSFAMGPAPGVHARGHRAAGQREASGTGAGGSSLPAGVEGGSLGTGTPACKRPRARCW